jgi:hypothetical protein
MTLVLEVVDVLAAPAALANAAGENRAGDPDNDGGALTSLWLSATWSSAAAAAAMVLTAGTVTAGLAMAMAAKGSGGTDAAGEAVGVDAELGDASNVAASCACAHSSRTRMHI